MRQGLMVERNGEIDDAEDDQQPVDGLEGLPGVVGNRKTNTRLAADTV